MRLQFLIRVVSNFLINKSDCVGMRSARQYSLTTYAHSFLAHCVRNHCLDVRRICILRSKSLHDSLAGIERSSSLLGQASRPCADKNNRSSSYSDHASRPASQSASQSARQPATQPEINQKATRKQSESNHMFWARFGFPFLCLSTTSLEP